MKKLNLKPIINILPKLSDSPAGFVRAQLSWAGPDIKLVDKPDMMSWSLPKALAERFKKAVEDGRVFHSPTLGNTTSNPSFTIVNYQHYFIVTGKYMNYDLKQIGY